MSLDQEQLNRLLTFVGYGNLDSNIWFLGMEEAGGGEDNLVKRLAFECVEDLGRGHRMLGITKHHDGNRVLQPTWRQMCAIVLALGGQATDRESLRRYQVEQLGRHHGDTLLAELMPIPKPAIGIWDYPNLLPQYQSARDYYAEVKPSRVRYIRELVRQHTPKLVIAYGSGFWHDYMQVFDAVDFSNDHDFMYGWNNGSLVLLTHHFTARSMNNGHRRIVDLVQRLSSDVDMQAGETGPAGPGDPSTSSG